MSGLNPYGLTIAFFFLILENLILASNEKLSNVKGNSSKVVDDIQQCNLTMINWINNFRFEQEPNCVKYYIYATMPGLLVCSLRLFSN